MITYRNVDEGVVVLFWKDGVPHIIGRHSLQDRARIVALGQYVQKLVDEGRLSTDMGDPDILWAITRAYSSLDDRAQLPRERLIEIAWERYIERIRDDEGNIPDWCISSAAWPNNEVTESIKRLKGECLLAVDRVTRTKRQGVVERFRVIFPDTNVQAESQTT